MSQGTATIELQVITGPDSGQAKTLTDPDAMVVGRGVVDFRVSDHSVSRRHFRVYWDRGELLWKDLDSRNGTYIVGGDKLSLQDGDIISAGDSRFLVRFLDHGSATHLGEGESREDRPLFSTLDFKTMSNTTDHKEKRDAESEAKEEIVSGVWKVSLPPGWEHEPHVGFTAMLEHGVRLSIVLNEDDLGGYQNLVDYVGSQLEVLVRLTDATRRTVGPLTSEGLDEALQMHMSLQSADNQALDVVQAFLRSGPTVAIVTCTAVGASVENARDHFNEFLSRAKLLKNT